MNTKIGEQWHCTNPACRREVLVQAERPADGGSRLCVCGSRLKKKYSPPTFTYLEFLRLEDPVSTSQGSRKG
jgi:hypothetical protein